MKNNQKGITLVALVITIIVLLILAGVSIAALSGQNGILTNASSAKQEDAIGAAKDIVAMAINESVNAYYTVTYAGGTNATVVAGDQQATAIAFIEAQKSRAGSDVEITIVGKSVQIKTTDKNPKTVHATISTDGALGTWTDGAASAS